MLVYLLPVHSSNLQQMKQNLQNSLNFPLQNIHQAASKPSDQSEKPKSDFSSENNGKWSQLQHVKYIVYMEFHKDKMRSKENRRSFKLYKQMSKFVVTRNPQQCRSHHQKLEDKYQYPNKIISHYKHHYSLSLYEMVKQKLEEFQNRTLTRRSHDVKMEDLNEENIIQVKASARSQNTVNQSPDHGSSQLYHDNGSSQWYMREIIYQPYDLIPNWLSPIYFPIYPIY